LAPLITVPNGVEPGVKVVSFQVKKNWLPLMFGPALAMATVRLDTWPRPAGVSVGDLVDALNRSGFTVSRTQIESVAEKAASSALLSIRTVTGYVRTKATRSPLSWI